MQSPIINAHSYCVPHYPKEMAPIRCTIEYVFISHMRIEEVVLPLGNTQETPKLVLEMSSSLWAQCQKRHFSDLLPWLTANPPEWTNLQAKCATSSRHNITYIKYYIIPGHYSTCYNYFRISEELSKKDDITSPAKLLESADLLIRREYSPSGRYQGITEEEAQKLGLAFFQKIPDPSRPDAGVEYWVLQCPKSKLIHRQLRTRRRRTPHKRRIAHAAHITHRRRYYL